MILLYRMLLKIDKNNTTAQDSLTKIYQSIENKVDRMLEKWDLITAIKYIKKFKDKGIQLDFFNEKDEIIRKKSIIYAENSKKTEQKELDKQLTTFTQAFKTQDIALLMRISSTSEDNFKKFKKMFKDAQDIDIQILKIDQVHSQHIRVSAKLTKLILKSNPNPVKLPIDKSEISLTLRKGENKQWKIYW